MKWTVMKSTPEYGGPIVIIGVCRHDLIMARVIWEELKSFESKKEAEKYSLILAKLCDWEVVPTFPLFPPGE